MSHNKQHKNTKGNKTKNYKTRHLKKKGGNPWDGAIETIPTNPTDTIRIIKPKITKVKTKMKVKKNGKKGKNKK